MTVKLTEDGSIHQSAGLSWSEHIYKVNPDGTVSYYMNRNGVWEEDIGYDNIADYEKENYVDDVGIMATVPANFSYNDNYQFDETDNTYNGTVEFMGAQATIKIKFENKKLVYLDLGTSKITLYDYGTTEIEIPTIA